MVNHSLQGLNKDGEQSNYSGTVRPPTSSPTVSMDIDAFYIVSPHLPINSALITTISLFFKANYENTIKINRMVYYAHLSEPIWISKVVNFHLAYIQPFMVINILS